MSEDNGAKPTKITEGKLRRQYSLYNQVVIHFKKQLQSNLKYIVYFPECTLSFGRLCAKLAQMILFPLSTPLSCPHPH